MPDLTLRLPPDPTRPSLERGAITFIGTATVLLQYAGITVLTDPNFLHAGDHVHLGYGMFSRRLTDPAMEIEDLPPLDLCVLSHFHGDHWDRVATAKLPKDLPVVTTPHAARALRRRGFARAAGIGRWGSLEATKGGVRLRVTAMPGRHGPPLFSRLLPPVMGSMLEWSLVDGPTLFRLYVSGDTLVHDDLRRIPERYPDVHLGLFHLGGTRVLGVLVTMDAGQGVEAIRIVRPRRAIPIHYDDYPVFKSPLAAFLREVRRARLETRVEVVARGERFEFVAPGAPARRPADALGRPARDEPAVGRDAGDLP